METVTLEGKETFEIDRAVERVTEALEGAIERHVPEIRTRKLPLPEIDPETKNMMEEVSRIKTLSDEYKLYKK